MPNDESSQAEMEDPSTTHTVYTEPQFAASTPNNGLLLSPPRNTWKAPSPTLHIHSPTPTRPAPRHRPTRSASAPPAQTTAPPPSPDPAPGTTVLTPPKPRPRRRFTTLTPFTSGELARPAPPLLRPTPFWRHTPRSSLVPITHLVRRATYIAAGLAGDAYTGGNDARALSVEGRIGAAGRVVIEGKVGEWEW